MTSTLTTTTRASSPMDTLATPMTSSSGLVTTLRHAAVLAKRSLIKLTRTPEQLIDVTLQPIIFLLLFTYIFGGALGHGSQHQYLQFLLPGLLGQSIAMAGVALGQNLNADIEKGVFDRFRSLPIARSAPLVGAVLGDVVRYVILCLVFAGFGSLIGFRVETNWLAAVAAFGISIAFALCFCWISVFVGMIVRTSGAVQGIMFLLVLPLSFGSNTFVSTDTLPGWLQAFVKVNPISHLVSTVRGLMIGGPVASHLAWTGAWMVGLLAVFVPLALRGYRSRA
ncbi:ABC transporter permease [Jatrophihabitans telluris]|uniref:Transport permease protein n=1 Tax=Jatrophihabitans telluris TaxID=2038343 RepID=A0ABY4R2X4_9ACTN|nr:ABC transporter permease [Jatrophihabitans telluris]UQX89601.1 ABC transporter permease [Jatrophihabitans telluris]